MAMTLKQNEALRKELDAVRKIAADAATQLSEFGPNHTSKVITLAYQQWGNGSRDYYAGISRGLGIAINALLHSQFGG